MRIVAGVLGAALAGSALVLAAAPAQAQDFPTKPVRVLVPFAPGGVVDVAARIVAQKLAEKWGQQVLVENRPGGNGFIAVTAVAKAPADGYTLLMAHTGEFSVNPAVFKDIPYELERDFQPITMVSDAPMVIAVKSDGPYQTGQQLIEGARAKPGTLGMGTPGTGSVNHLAGEWFGLGAGVKFLHVPYRGGAPAMTATAAGEVPWSVAAISSGLSHIQSGRVKVLAVTTAKRAAFNPDWPTAQEVGAKGVDTSIWTGMFAPKGVPPAIVDKIYTDLAAVLQQPDVQEKFKAGGAAVGGMKPAEFTAKVKTELSRLKEVVEAANVKPE